MGIKTSVILVEKSLGYLDSHACQLQSSHFLHKIHSNALPLEEVVLGGNENLWIKNFFVIKISLPSERYGTFDEILHYKSFSLPPFNTINQTGRKWYRKVK